MTGPLNSGAPDDETSRWAPPGDDQTPAEAITPVTSAAPVTSATPQQSAPTPTPAANGEPPMPPYEPAEPGTSAPAEAVAREGTAGADAPGGRRRNGIRWAIALVGVALVVGATAVIIALASGRPAVSIAVGYMPDEVVQYGEYRLDLPGDQRQKLASFLSAFPGFDDEAAIDTKLDETFDRIIGSISNGDQSWTRDIEPWFGGVVAVGSGPMAVGDGTPSMAMFGGQPLVVVSIKD